MWACPKMRLDAARPVITRYGVCSPIHVVKFPAVTEHYGSSSCSQNPLNPHSQSRTVSLHICVRVVVQFGPVTRPAVLPITRLLCNPNSITMLTRARILSRSRFCRFTPSHLICCNICFNNSFPWALVYFMRYHFSIKIYYVFVMYVLHDLRLVVPVTCSLSPYPRGQPSHQSIKDLIQYIWRVRRIDTDDTSSQKSVDLLVQQRAMYASY